jgi:hypothetical protein
VAGDSEEAVELGKSGGDWSWGRARVKQAVDGTPQGSFPRSGVAGERVQDERRGCEGGDKAGKEEAAVEACGWVGSNGLEVGFPLVRVLYTKETRSEPSDPRLTAVKSCAIWATWASLVIIFLFLFSFCCTIVK